jgi:CRP-like cAMP-binding protein
VEKVRQLLLTRAHAETTNNRILASLPQEELDQLLPDCRVITARHGHVYQEPDEPMENVYFPLSGMLSLVTIMEDGSSVEAATIGTDGVGNVRVCLGAELAAGRLIVHLDGQLLRVSTSRFRAHLPTLPVLQMVLNRYVDSLLVLFAQSGACNRLHSIGQRCARWLLMTHDRVGCDEFSLTQQTLSQLLGVRRASVSEVASELQAEGLIRYSHGKLAILSRTGLQVASCECYDVTQRQLAAQLSELPRATAHSRAPARHPT